MLGKILNKRNKNGKKFLTTLKTIDAKISYGWTIL
jgi:hypothetical protein